MQVTRRFFVRGTLALLALASLPKALWAAAWPQSAFKATVARDALVALLGTDDTTPSDRIKMKIPEIAENGAVVPVLVETDLERVESISIVLEKNPRPLAASFEIPAGTLPRIAARLKMAKTGNVIAVVKTNTGIFSATRVVKVTIGGCGG